MSITKPILLAMLMTAASAPAAPEQHRMRSDIGGSDQYSVMGRVRRGEIKPLNEIEQRILPRMRGADYLGPELEADRYRLKFMRGGSVIWVDVDARTGQIIGRTGE